MSKYECNQCRAKFDELPFWSCSCAIRDTECPKCGSQDVSKIEECVHVADYLKNFRPPAT